MDENSIRKELAKTIADDSQNIDKILKLTMYLNEHCKNGKCLENIRIIN